MRRRALFLLALPMPARAAGVEDVMRGLAAVRESRAVFRETRAIPELEGVLPSRGTLSWRAPDRVEKHTTEPVEERLTVAGDTLTLERRGTRQVLSLDAAPEVRALVEAIRGTLAGDLPRLSSFYDVRFSEPGDGSWRISLYPRSARLAAAVQAIIITGRGAQIGTVETQERGGITSMSIEARP
ncbi:LolA family protein [Plastoroseomonas arctica]|uniref:Outer membrane lipoprotein carrier protein LolA n=1 Tax=Plastoroseomonas arctica TaxID=1509237 RepID=A0AAF1KL53_9PROT|nr:LolA-related protein [Plastoroseomonas arctica]MBR0657450.1 outer membrane lipoprotein carrier protein LolA [Plastoroseomonas arctica]